MSLISTKTIRYVISVIFFIVAVFVFYAFIHLIPIENHNPILPYCDFCKEHLPYKKKVFLLYDCSECGSQMITSLLNFLFGSLLCAPFMFLSWLFYRVLN